MKNLFLHGTVSVKAHAKAEQPVWHPGRPKTRVSFLWCPDAGQPGVTYEGKCSLTLTQSTIQ